MRPPTDVPKNVLWCGPQTACAFQASWPAVFRTNDRACALSRQRWGTCPAHTPSVHCCSAGGDPPREPAVTQLIRPTSRRSPLPGKTRYSRKELSIFFTLRASQPPFKKKQTTSTAPWMGYVTKRSKGSDSSRSTLCDTPHHTTPLRNVARSHGTITNYCGNYGTSYSLTRKGNTKGHARLGMTAERLCSRKKALRCSPEATSRRSVTQEELMAPEKRK